MGGEALDGWRFAGWFGWFQGLGVCLDGAIFSYDRFVSVGLRSEVLLAAVASGIALAVAPAGTRIIEGVSHKWHEHGNRHEHRLTIIGFSLGQPI